MIQYDMVQRLERARGHIYERVIIGGISYSAHLPLLPWPRSLCKVKSAILSLRCLSLRKCSS